MTIFFILKSIFSNVVNEVFCIEKKRFGTGFFLNKLFDFDNKTLFQRETFVDHSFISQNEIQAFTKALTENTCLKELLLCNNQIGDEGVQLFAQVLIQNTSLKGLGLFHNGIGHKGAQALAQAFTRWSHKSRYFPQQELYVMPKN
jgi:Ran GTPase-activating protein (RanGAP) involved in mRNA processing and transport